MTEQAVADEADLEPVLDETAEVEAGEGDEGGQSQDDAPQIGFEGDEAAPASDGENATGLVAQLRARIREQAKELQTARTAPEPQVIVGDEPTMEGCEYDHDRFATEYRAWTDRKAKSERADEDRKAAWGRELAGVEAQRAALKIPAQQYEAASGTVKDALTDLQQAVLVRAANNPAALIYALAKSPSRLEALVAIDDPVKLSAEIGRLEGNLKMTARRAPPPPEQIVRGSAPLSRATDKEYERLEKEADRTGDRTKFVQYKRRLRDKAK